MGLLTNALVVVNKLEAKCCFGLLHFCPLCDVLRGNGRL